MRQWRILDNLVRPFFHGEPAHTLHESGGGEKQGNPGRPVENPMPACLLGWSRPRPNRGHGLLGQGTRRGLRRRRDNTLVVQQGHPYRLILWPCPNTG